LTSFSSGLKQNIDMYSERFLKAIEEAEKNDEGGIGTYKERSQHKVLKYFFEPDPAFHEVPLRSYIADICRDDQIYEIQTSGFENLTSKLEDFLTDHHVTIIFPAPIVKTVIWTDPETGESISGRRIRRNGDKFKLLSELLHISRFISEEKIKIVVVKTEINDMRLLDGRGADKKIKATKTDKIPVGIIDIETLSSAEDIKKFAEIEDGILYTRADFQKKFGLIRRNLSGAIKSLILLGVIKEHGRENRKVFYTSCN